MDRQNQLTLLENSFLKCSVTNYGARLVSLQFKNKNGHWKELTAGYDKWEEYRLKNNYFGAICGRYANRIAFGKLIIEDHKYELDRNHHGHHLHGGTEGFQNRIWHIHQINSQKLELIHSSPAGHMKYPALVEFKITYEISGSTLIINYSAIPNEDTVINIAPHFYFNLGNEDTIYNHDLLIHSDQITEVDKEAIPTGVILTIKDSSLDFTTMKKIGAGIYTQDPFISMFGGYDHNFVLPKNRNHDHFVAQLQSSDSGIAMKIYTSQPGLQLYTCNWADQIEKLRFNKIYTQHSFVCLESQHFPDSPNHSNFPTTLVKANQEYHHYSHYEFSNF